MPVLNQPSVADTFTVLIRKIRQKADDPLSTTSNNRFTPTQVLDALDDTLAELWEEMSNRPSAAHSEYEDITYTVGGVAIPADREASRLYKVEHMRDPTAPYLLDYFPGADFRRIDGNEGWAFNGANILILPDIAGSIRVHFLANFTAATGADPDTDQHNLPVNFQNLLVLGAAICLREQDEDKVPVAMLLRYNRLKKLFLERNNRNKGRTFVKSARRYG
jgi:hypothetical protein